jgi:pimeloyl-ACP methyl ester carboxylesterase
MVGWSDGAIIALNIAMHHPERVRHVAVTGANFRVDGLAAPVLEWLRTVKPDDFEPDLVATYKRLSPDGPQHWPVFFERFRKMALTEPDYAPQELATIRAPTLVMAGDHDIIRLEHTIELAHAIPGARLCIYPGGHGWLMGKPDAFNAVVDSFLEEKPAK